MSFEKYPLPAGAEWDPETNAVYLNRKQDTVFTYRLGGRVHVSVASAAVSCSVAIDHRIVLHVLARAGVLT